jgi:uncharacterized protein (TIGR02145 family)
MQTKHLFLLPALAFFACAGLQAQVSIGSTIDDPATGALLDLNTPNGNKGGLLLSNVSIADLSIIPFETNLFPGISVGNAGTNIAFTGAMIYHTGENDIPAGVYVWNGGRWVSPGKDDPSILYDAEMNDYNIGDFGTAGIWMTQNLRSTQYSDGTTLTMGGSTIANEKRYDYPGPSTLSTAEERRDVLTTAQLEAYGLLYSWVAASGRGDNTADNTVGEDGKTQPGYGTNPPTSNDYKQGICPKNWHLPSDYEWSQLEEVIAKNPSKYSTQDESYGEPFTFFPTTSEGGFSWRPGLGNNTNTWWGRQMKSTTGVPDTGELAPYSSSRKREEGGFDALLVGSMNNGVTTGYGSYADFWTSSSYNSTAVYRYLHIDNTGMARYNIYTKAYLRSVRCKKD